VQADGIKTNAATLQNRKFGFSALGVNKYFVSAQCFEILDGRFLCLKDSWGKGTYSIFPQMAFQEKVQSQYFKPEAFQRISKNVFL